MKFMDIKLNRNTEVHQRYIAKFQRKSDRIPQGKNIENGKENIIKEL